MNTAVSNKLPLVFDTILTQTDIVGFRKEFQLFTSMIQHMLGRFFKSFKIVFLILFLVSFLGSVTVWSFSMEQSQVTESNLKNCDNETGGWETRCLLIKNQQLDELLMRVYWRVQNKIKNNPEYSQLPEYKKQFHKLLRANEVDFIRYFESYCNMQIVLLVNDTELNKMLKCSIFNHESRINELKKVDGLIDEASKVLQNSATGVENE